MTTPLIQTRGLVKRFGGTTALKGVDLDIREGEIHALLGENGAGKSTLIKILAGVHSPDAGQILYRGEVADARTGALPISFVHQDPGLVDDTTIAENIALAAGFPRRLGLVEWHRVVAEARAAIAKVGFELNPKARVSSLSSAERAIVGIVRCLAVEAQVIVLDEPTASLPEADVERVFAILDRLRQSGLAVLYVTHRLDEVFRLSDWVTVLRDGARVASLATRETTPDRLVSAIVGREVQAVAATRPPPATADPALQLTDVRVRAIGPFSLTVRKGEVVALVGLRGAGHHLVGRAVAGAERVVTGTVKLDGQEVTLRNPAEAGKRGVSFLPGNRAMEGLFGGLSLAPAMSVQENLVPDPRGTGLVLWPRRERRYAMELIRRYDVRPPEPAQTITALSGGNQQKVVLARSIERGNRVLVLEEPTLGVDVGAKAEIYRMFDNVLAEGRAVLLVSSDFEEVARVSHRAIVFLAGRMVCEISQQDLSIENLISAASGALDIGTTTRYGTRGQVAGGTEF